MAKYITACPVNCYSTCSMIVEVDNGRIVSLEADPGNKATGISICLKGLSHLERVYSEERILTPLIKTSGQGVDAVFNPISWKEALELLANKLNHCRDSYGAKSVLYYTASGQKGLLNEVGIHFFKLFGGCTIKYGDLCWQAGLEATRLTLGANKHNAPWDLENADLILLWGKNPAETNVQQMQYIYAALDKGAQLIVIDPRRTQSSERADHLLQLRPGSDGALALGLANQLIKTKGIDTDFISRHVLGFDEFHNYVRGFSLERTSRLTDIAAEDIRLLAEKISGSQAMTLCCGFGLQRYTNSGQSLRAILALSVITGNLGRPGASWVYSNLQSAIFDKTPSPQAAYPPVDSDKSSIRCSLATARLGADILKTDNPAIKMAIISRANPITQNPDSSTTTKALRGLDFTVTIDHFLTDTARESDLVLPATSMFELSDIVTGYWHPYIQLRQKVIAPVREAKSEPEIFYMLTKKLGYSDEDIEGILPFPDAEGIETFLAAKLAPFPELSLEKLKKGPILCPGFEEVAFADFCFPTPSGKIELFSKEARQLWEVDEIAKFRPPQESTGYQEETVETKSLFLLTPNSKNHIHSQFNNLKNIRQFSPAPFAEIHPQEAFERGIEDGERVRIFNSRGSITVIAKLDLGIRTGCICVHNGWWLSEGGGVNLLSHGRETDMGHGAAFHDNLVEVERG